MPGLAGHSYGRAVGTNSDALPAVLAVNFASHSGDTVFLTVPGTKLEAGGTGAVVAFEVDHLGSAEGESWSVLVRGLAEEVTGPGRRAEVGPLVPGSWASGDVGGHLVRTPVTMISGRRLRSAQRGERTGGGDCDLC